MLSVFALSVGSCKKKEEAPPPNPFDDPSLQAPPTNTTSYSPPANSFEYIYHNIFNVTCNNSGCHDGSFEPDFRNLSSSYNSLVYAPVIITPTNNPYIYRVMPGDASKSLLKHRLVQMPGSGIGTLGQGRMPWNDTNWMYRGSNPSYIQSVINWINEGAKDVFGNSPLPGNKQPGVHGLQICNTGTNVPFTRSKYISISKNNGPVDIWIYATDAETSAQNLTNATIKFSTNRNDFTNATSQSLSYINNGNSYQDITLSGTVSYNYKLSNFSLNTILPDTGYIFMRAYFKDPDHAEPSETPNAGAQYHTDYFVIKITP